MVASWRILMMQSFTSMPGAPPGSSTDVRDGRSEYACTSDDEKATLNVPLRAENPPLDPE
jgi:hypothetical protein